MTSSQARRYADRSDSAAGNRDSAADRYASRSAAGEVAKDYRKGFRNSSASVAAEAKRTYTVAEGDSLFDIARCELGKASRWVEIYDLNTDVIGKDIDCLAPGTQIVLPNDDHEI